MKMAIDDPDGIDSTCDARPFGAEGTGSEERCQTDAKTWVTLLNGARLYLCPDHAEEVDRFDGGTEDHPTVIECDECNKLTPRKFTQGDRTCENCL